MIEVMIEMVQSMDLLNLEPGEIALLTAVFLGYLVALSQCLESILVQLLFHLHLAQVEEKLIGLLEICIVHKFFNSRNGIFLIGSTSEQISNDICHFILTSVLQKICVDVYR